MFFSIKAKLLSKDEAVILNQPTLGFLFKVKWKASNIVVRTSWASCWVYPSNVEEISDNIFLNSYGDKIFFGLIIHFCSEVSKYPDHIWVNNWWNSLINL